MVLLYPLLQRTIYVIWHLFIVYLVFMYLTNVLYSSFDLIHFSVAHYIDIDIRLPNPLLELKCSFYQASYFIQRVYISPDLFI